LTTRGSGEANRWHSCAGGLTPATAALSKRSMLEDDQLMAHKKGQGSSRNGRDSNAQRLGIKLWGGQLAKPGSILCRQHGTSWRPGKNVGVGRDWTIYSLIEGKVQFDQGGRRINVLPLSPAPAAAAANG
jgi:large subunit ribosomal protein L27